MKELDRSKSPKKPPQKRTEMAGKTSSTESGRVAGQLGGLYVRGRAKSSGEKVKGKAKAPEHD